MLQSTRSNIPEIRGYAVDSLLGQEAGSVLYRAHRAGDAAPVLIKFAETRGGAAHDTARLRREFEICRELDLNGILRPLALETTEAGLALVMEDFSGPSLRDILNEGPPSLEESLRIATALTRVLGDVHHRGIIHKDIKPAAILIHAQDIKLSNFGIASRLSREEQSARSPGALEGTPAYVSPEQTGRMNRSLDYRSDFYSLGVTLYELLTGQPPFTSPDPMELVHAHIARVPPAPHEKDANIPEALSRVVMKLLAKTAENRYQSAFGLNADLEFCARALSKTGSLPDFTPAQNDRSEVFSIPEKLYGREKEITRLLETFGEAREGGNKLLLVAGYSGIGKSSLVNEVQRPITEARGYFISGKFDQFKRDIPYSAVIQAFQDLVRQLLTEESIETWTESLRAALGNAAGVIVDVIPEVELIIGPQKPVDELGPTESENRFNLVFRKFVRALAHEDHPLVIFLDDLQWADTASLKLIHQLSSDPDMSHLLLLGAYRDNETGHGHPLLDMLEKARRDIGAIDVITPAVLAPEHIRMLMADALLATVDETHSLAELVGEKTGGNPFFTREFLKELYRNGSLDFHRESGRWRWDTERIRAMDITDNVVDLMAGKILELPENSREALKIAACVGNRFDLGLLSIVLRKPTGDLARELESAMRMELILPLNDEYKYVNGESEGDGFDISYRFVHDRVQQAAYQAIPENERRQVHLMIGRLIPRSHGDPRREERLIDIVNHLNLGAELIEDFAERMSVAELNLAAGRNARSSAAYGSALTYLSAASSLLPEAAWSSHYSLTLEIRLELLEAYYLNGDYDRADAFADEILRVLKEPLDRMRVYLFQVPAQNSAGRPGAALDIVRKALRELNIRLPGNPGKLAVIKDVLITKLMLARRSPHKSTRLPELDDPIILAVKGLLSEAATSAFFLSSNLFPIMILYIVRLSIRHGYSSYSPFAFVIYGMILNGTLGEFKAGYDYSRLALRLQEQLGARELTARIIFLHGYFLHHWEHDLADSSTFLEEAAGIGWETGNLEYLGYSLACRTFIRFITGEDLALTHEIALKDLTVLRNTKQEQGEAFFKPFVHLLETLGAPASHINAYSHDETYAELLAEKNYLCVCYSSFCAGIGRAWLHDYEGAVRAFRQAEPFYDTIRGNPWLGTFHYFFGSALLSASAPNRRAKRRNLKEAKKHYKILAKAAAHQPLNRRQKALLLKAELAAARSRHAEALEDFAASIEFSRENKFPQDEALGLEKLGAYLLSRGEDEGLEKLTRARDLYSAWGAQAKVDQLNTHYNVPVAPAEDHMENKRDWPEAIRAELEAALSDFTLTSQREIDFELQLDGPPPASAADAVTEAMHILLRNAAAHGIEDSDRRVAAGKSPRGRIALSLTRGDEMLNLICRDDGRGLDPELIRVTAAAQGLIAEGRAAALAKPALYRLLFHSEFTTASGKQFGLGLNRLRHLARELEGKILLQSREGEFTRVELRFKVPVEH